MNQQELLAAALEEMKRAQWPPDKWCRAIRNSAVYNYPVTANYKAQNLLWEAAHAPAPVPPKQPNLLAGHGLFTAWQADVANGRGADWVALQADPEGRHDGFVAGTARVLVWESRPLRGMEAVHSLNALGYIAEAESPPAFEVCMQIGPSITCPKYIVGKPNGWGYSHEEVDAAMARARDQGWGLCCEWYWNDNFASNPDSSGYRVDAWLFGCFDGKQGRKYLDEYRAVCPGSYGCYTTETLTQRDWAVFS